MKDQIEKIQRDVHCLSAELTSLNIKKETRPDAILETNIQKLKNLIKAKENLINTLIIEFSGD
jgi:hypothetical protein